MLRCEATKNLKSLLDISVPFQISVPFHRQVFRLPSIDTLRTPNL